MKSRVMEALKASFRPELLNRVDETIVFHGLEKEHIVQNCAVCMQMPV